LLQGCHATIRPIRRTAQNVSHCISLSTYLVDVIVISKILRWRRLFRGAEREMNAVDIGGRAQALASSFWETP
jgi:hypothetical protein